MKQIQSACLEQTIHFQLRDDIPQEQAVHDVQHELESYKVQLARKRTKYKIVEEAQQPDGSVLLKIKKQYNRYDCGHYMDD